MQSEANLQRRVVENSVDLLIISKGASGRNSNLHTPAHWFKTMYTTQIYRRLNSPRFVKNLWKVSHVSLSRPAFGYSSCSSSCS